MWKDREIELVKRRSCQITENEKGCYDSHYSSALGTITTKFENYFDSLGIKIRTDHVQKSGLLGSARIIRKVLFS